jgi:HD-like signal output (HDOD) protein
MNVLFVDDEPRVLEGIERMLFQFDLDWDVSFAESGQAALHVLAEKPFDVIVSDMRMPGMDGAALLARVCERYPSVIRIVLSGQTDEDSALRVVRVAHQFLAKPCQPETIRRVIESTRDLKLLLDDPKLQATVGQVDRLPSAPRLFTELSRLLEDENSDIEKITRVVQQDPAMAGKLLQVVNSAFFTASTTVKDLRTAVVRLGMKTLRNLVLGVGAFDAAGPKVGPEVLSVDTLQRYSLRVARLASRAATREEADEAFMAGLVCDIGQLVLATTAPATLREVRAAEKRGVKLHKAEYDLLGVTHAEIGAFLLGVWGLPFRIVEAVANHHMPERNAHDRLGVAQAVYLAVNVAAGEEPDPDYVQRIGATQKLVDLKAYSEKIGE